MQIMEPVNGKFLSHRSVRFVVHRNSAEAFLGYTGCHYQFSCKEVLRLINVAISKMGINEVKNHLIAVNQGDIIGMSQYIPTFLERIFELHTLDKGIQCKYRQMQLNEIDREINREINWSFFVVKFKRVEHTKTLFQNMVEDVLYYPNDLSFPLVDMYYMDKSRKLIGIQATMSEIHAKGVTTYQRFYDEIGTNPDTTPLMLYYLLHARE